MKLLTDDLVEYFDNKLKKTKNKDKAKEICNRLFFIKKLQGVSAIKNVIECSKGLFYHPDILKKFNTKAELFSFDNNITYNIRTKEVYPTKKEDYILYTCGYDFPERDQNDIDLVNEDIFNSLYEKENINYAKSLLSTLIYGENINEHFIVHQGIGRNGKGLMDNLLQSILCNYYIPFSPEQFTEYQKDKNRANSELAQSIGKRCVMTTEPESGSTIKTENLKRLTGRDPITTRELHSKTTTFKNTFTINIQANDLPRLSKIDDAIEKRMKILNYPFQFVHQDKKVRDYQRIIDVELKDKVRYDTRYRNGMLWILFDTWYENKGLVINNQEADELKQEEMNKSNPLSEFLDKYEKSDKFMLISLLHKKLKEDGYDMKLSEFKSYLSLSGYEIKIDKSNGDKIKLQLKNV
jgi:phage/plasmid-associated DNA primase